MQLSEEIQALRRELSGVERTVARLALRLDEVEARQHGLDPGAKASAKSHPPANVAPLKKEEPQRSIVPPPLPSSYPTGKIPASPKPLVPIYEAAPKKTTTAPLPPKSVPKPKKPRRFGPPTDMSFEMALGSYWLPRIGMLLLAIGTVWGFTLAAQYFQDSPWVPYARVALGYGLSGALLGIGYWLEKKYANYARVLMGGGLGLLYFVTFATWYIPATRIAPSQEFTLALLGLLVLGWGALAQWRQSQLIALTMTLLGHFTVALSTLSLDMPSRTAVGGLLLLGIGSAWFLVRNGWYLVAMSAMIGSYLNQFFWLSKSPGSDLPVDFAVGMTVLVAYLMIFATAEFLTPPERRTVPPRVRSFFVGLNTGAFVLLSLGLMRAFSFTQPHEHLLYFATALFTLGMGLGYAHRDAKDRVIATYFAKTSVLVAIGFATWLDGTTLTLSLALEALVLLLTARYRREHTGRLLALGTAVVTFLHGCYSLLTINFPAYGEAGFAGEASVALGIVVVFGVLTECYRVTSWHTFSAISFSNMPTLNALCQNMEMMPEGYAGDAKPSRMAFAHLLAGIGVLLAAGYIGVLLPQLTTSAAVGWLALAVAGVGLWRRSAPLLTGTVFLSGTSVVWWFQHLDERSIGMNESLVPLIIVAVPLLIISELLRVLALSRMQPYALLEGIQGAWYRNMQSVVLVVAAAAASVIGLSILEDLKPENVVLLTGSLALIATIFAACLGSYSMGLFALLVMLLTPSSAVYLILYDFATWKTGLGVLLLGITATSVESRWWGERPGLAFQRLLPTPYLLYGVFVWWSYWFVSLQVPLRAVVVTVVGLAVLLALALPWLHRRAMALYSTLLCTVALFGWMVISIIEPMTTWWYASFAAITLAALGGDRLFAHYKPFPKPIPGRILLVVAWLACYHFNAEVVAPVWYYVGLAAIALAFLGYGAAFRTRTALALSLLAAGLATVPLMLSPFGDTSVGAICAAYGAVILYWLCAERGATRILSRTGFTLLPGHRPALYAALTGIPALLGVIGLTHIDLIQDFYLTISWTVWALALFAWAVGTRQPWFRYVGLCTIGLALGRAFLIDVWKLEGLYRVGAMLFLGVALLGVAYGYTRWRGVQETMEAGSEEREGEK